MRRRYDIACRAGTCVLFIPLVEVVNGAQFLNIAFLLVLVLFAGAAAAAVFGTVIVALTCIYASL